MSHQVLMLLSITVLVSSSSVQLMNGRGHCLAGNSPAENHLVTANCAKLPNQLWIWDSQSRLCNEKNLCLYIRAPLEKGGKFVVLWPALPVEGQTWHFTRWGRIIDVKGQCLNSGQSTGDAYVVPCNGTSFPGQQWKRVLV